MELERFGARPRRVAHHSQRELARNVRGEVHGTQLVDLFGYPEKEKKAKGDSYKHRNGASTMLGCKFIGFCIESKINIVGLEIGDSIVATSQFGIDG